MDKTKALAELKELQNRATELERILSEPDKDKLHLVIDRQGDLVFKYKDSNLGWLQLNDKRLYVLSSASMVEAYDQWIEDDIPTDHSEIEWNGGTYRIAESTTLQRIDILAGAIYTFDKVCTIPECRDNNVLRRGSNTPLIF